MYNDFEACLVENTNSASLENRENLRGKKQNGGKLKFQLGFGGLFFTHIPKPEFCSQQANKWNFLAWIWRCMRLKRQSKGANTLGVGEGKAAFLGYRTIAGKYSRHWEQSQQCKHNNLNDALTFFKHSYMVFHLISQEGVVLAKQCFGKFG